MLQQINILLLLLECQFFDNFASLLASPVSSSAPAQIWHSIVSRIWGKRVHCVFFTHKTHSIMIICQRRGGGGKVISLCL